MHWDVALLQESPPRWAAAPRRGARRRDPHHSHLTQLAAARCSGRFADLNPDLIASSEGGSNLTLVRGALLERIRAGDRRAPRAGDPRGPPRAAHDGLHPPIRRPLRRQPARHQRPPRPRRARGTARRRDGGRVGGRTRRCCSAATSTCARPSSPRSSSSCAIRYGLGAPDRTALDRPPARPRVGDRRGPLPPSATPRSTARAGLPRSARTLAPRGGSPHPPLRPRSGRRRLSVVTGGEARNRCWVLPPGGMR